MPWVYTPHHGGKKIPSEMYKDICKKVESFERARPWYPKTKLKVRFKAQFCYIDTIEEGDGRLFHLCRLRLLHDGWSFALYTYSNECYEPCAFPDGNSVGEIKDALKMAETFII